MKFGTLFLNNKIYDLDYMKKIELENLFESNNHEKSFELSKAKKICKREIDENLQYSIEDIPNEFKAFMDNCSNYAKSEAIIQRALVQKTSYDAIVDKVNFKRNGIRASIKNINAKFNKSNKKYNEIQSEIDKSIKKYESILYELSDFFDTKIEQLILKKLELEAHLVGSIIKEEYLIEEENNKKDAKENDKLLLALSNSVKNFMNKLTKKKEQKEIDVTLISKLQDKEDLEEEQKDRLNNLVENTINLRKENLEKISNLEKEILSIEKEIKRLNENKEKAIIEAMESSSKDLVLKKSKGNLVEKIRVFFKSRINPAYVIYENIINPMNEYINSYEENVLENIKK